MPDGAAAECGDTVPDDTLCPAERPYCCFGELGEACADHALSGWWCASPSVPIDLSEPCADNSFACSEDHPYCCGCDTLDGPGGSIAGCQATDITGYQPVECLKPISRCHESELVGVSMNCSTLWDWEPNPEWGIIPDYRNCPAELPHCCAHNDQNYVLEHFVCADHPLAGFWQCSSPPPGG